MAYHPTLYERTPTIEVRASKSSETSSSETSDFCKLHPKDDQCEKPVSDNSVTIALSIVLPCLAIFAVLGWFLYRNYRKDKKESLEHDPDFDENGEATALPDYPQMKRYQEDPFHNRNSIRYPMDNYNQYQTQQYPQQYGQYDQRNDPYIDSFVLPYKHQTGSKLSLDDYARNLGDSQGYRTPSNALERSRSGSMHLDNMTMATGDGAMSKAEASAKSPTKKKDGKQYTNIPNESTPSFAGHDYNKEISHITEATESSDDMSSPREKFAVKYENESHFNLNQSAIPQIVVGDHEERQTANDDGDSPFDNSGRTTETTVDTSPQEKLRGYDDDATDGDFTFSTQEDTEENQLQVAPHASRPKSPRLSAFNLLQNVSDDEDEEEEYLTPEQKEEIKRMKSVYKVYFDKDSEPKARKYDLDENSYPVLPDKINNELSMDTDYAKRFSNTSSVYNEEDVQYHQQYYYNQFDQQYQQQFGAPVDPQMYEQLQQQSYINYYEQEQQQRKLQSKKPLPPLQNLPSASDFRKSTLQTYTNFKPTLKNQTVVSPPTGKQPFVPIENDHVWSSPINSPSIQSQASFQQQQYLQQQQQQNQQTYYQQDGYFPPQSQPQPAHLPSATQLSRSSVVMLNPVTEITKQRKFKPAGSLPSVNPGYQQFGQSDLNGPESDLLPGNRKSDVRRMMNSNF
ncbi:hypothetical protein SBY92_002254 [Candida maltosa Xu316]|uniref:Uncharacterized protein n=1 Tax=Candida maltosa (strain Xu316) TaxID=1245528 RepID=M3IHN8_CANMX|nr:hypothetical protein G210_3921 [Candida maltosa Xu316]